MNALELADILENKIPSIECLEVSAAELRRLHAINSELVEALEDAEKILKSVLIYTNKYLTTPLTMPSLDHVREALEKAKQ